MLILTGTEDKTHLSLIRSGQSPRFDYRMVAARCRGQVMECYPSPSMLKGPKVARSCRSLYGNLKIAAKLMRSISDKEIIYSTGETWGLPVALVSGIKHRRCNKHIAYVHRIYSPSWQWFVSQFKSLLHVDGWICVTDYQARLLRKTLGPNGALVKTVSQGVDTQFFDPQKANLRSGRKSYVLSVGAEMRNYPLLLEATCDLGVEVIIKASSAWMNVMREELSDVPSNVKLLTKRLSYPELRDLYAEAALIVLPLYDTPQAAGITTILEAMSMGKCVISTHSRGLPDVLVNGLTGIITEPTSDALAEEINILLSDKEKAHELGNKALEIVEKKVSIESHASQVADFIEQVSKGVLPGAEES